MNAHLNNFSAKAVGVDQLGAALIDASENWWHCSFGPGSNGSCATVTGAGVTTSPWLTEPFDPDDDMGYSDHASRYRDDDGHRR